MTGRREADKGDVELTSPWPLEQCQAVLAASMDGSLLARGNQPVIGKVSGTQLRARKRISYRNSFQTSLKAELAEQGGHTRIHCRFGMHPLVTVFMVVWLGGVLTIGGGISASLLPDLARQGFSAPSDTWLGVAIPAGMAVFGVALVWLGRLIARNERRFLLEFLRDTLSAVPPSPPGQPGQ